MTEVPVAAYLRRIGMDPQTGPPTLKLLAALQLAHLTTVPFENLAVFHHRGPRTSLDWSVPKVVDQRRGGWCFELNGAFGALLMALGFDADHVACRVWEGNPGNPTPADWGPEFDHLGVVVRLDGEHWFVDVGFGDCCLVPLPLRAGEYDAAPRRARMEPQPGGSCVLHALLPPDGDGRAAAAWTPQLHIDPTPRRLDEFDGRSHHLQTEATSTWRQKPFATRALDGTGSRVTLRRGLLRRRAGTDPFADERVEEGAPQDALLVEWFGLDDSFSR